jgi:hypothetical protein
MRLPTFITLAGLEQKTLKKIFIVAFIVNIFNMISIFYVVLFNSILDNTVNTMRMIIALAVLIAVAWSFAQIFGRPEITYPSSVKKPKILMHEGILRIVIIMDGIALVLLIISQIIYYSQ